MPPIARHLLHALKVVFFDGMRCRIEDETGLPPRVRPTEPGHLSPPISFGGKVVLPDEMWLTLLDEQPMKHNNERTNRPGWKASLGGERSGHRGRHRLRPSVLPLEERQLMAVAVSAIVVNNPTDTTITGETSLRQAIQSDTTGLPIIFDSSVFGTAQTITLTQGALDITNNLSIQGPNAALTINGGGANSVFKIESGVSATISGLTITGGSATSGGGIDNLGTLTLTYSTITGNTASGNGGGLYESKASVYLKDDTFAGNSAYDGGALYLNSQKGSLPYSSANLVDCTISGNSASKTSGLGGASVNNYSSITLNDTIIAKQLGGGDLGGKNIEISGPSANNLIGNGTTFYSPIVKNGTNGNIVGGSGTSAIDPLLTSLGDYGGPTPTMALLPGSPAIGAGAASGLTTDQRGFARGSSVDIGAFQTQSATTLVVSNTGDSGAAPGQYDLRGAVNVAGTMATATTVTFDSTVFGTPQTITLANGPLVLSAVGGSPSQAITGPAAALTVSGNNASQVFSIQPKVTASISGLTITGGLAKFGGGVGNGGTLSLTDVTLSGNSATSGGGGVGNLGTLYLTNVTLSGNSANLGGGIDNLTSASATLIGVTVSGNSGTFGGGIYNSGFLSLTDTIVAKQVGGADIENHQGTLSGTYNLIGDGTGQTTLSSTDGHHNQVGNSTSSIDPLLAPLGNYGGSTQTMALLPGSPAIGAGIQADYPGTTTPITTDQRGLPRSGAIDIGAVQEQGYTLSVTNGDNQTTLPGTVFPKSLEVTISPNYANDPVTGGLITFAAPTSGPSATLSGSAVTINASGQASVTATANNSSGGYTVTASTAGAASSAVFNLFNEASLNAISVQWGTYGTAVLNLPTTSGGSLLPTGRTNDVPWLGIDQFTITLNGPATLSPSDITVGSAVGASYGPVTVSGSGETYTITLANPVRVADRLTITIGNADISTMSGTLNVLPGDVGDYGVVNVADLLLIQYQYVGVVTPNLFGDITGDVPIGSKPTIDDFVGVRTRLNTRLPS